MNTANMEFETVKTVEQALQEADSIITIAELKRRLPEQVNRLKAILEHLERNNKVIMSSKGITWIYNPSKKLQQAIQKGIEL